MKHLMGCSELAVMLLQEWLQNLKMKKVLLFNWVELSSSFGCFIGEYLEESSRLSKAVNVCHAKIYARTISRANVEKESKSCQLLSAAQHSTALGGFCYGGFGDWNRNCGCLWVL